MNTAPRTSHSLLIATVGNSPEPILMGVKYWRPARIVFVTSRETATTVTEVLRLAGEEGIPIEEGLYEEVRIEDAQDFGASVRDLKELDAEVQRWTGRSAGDHDVIVELTGGTKAMSSALALVARPWPCTFSYVGGDKRTKDGIVVSGTERVIHRSNPWDTLGYQAVEDASLAFDTGSYAIAIRHLEDARSKAADLIVKRELTAVLHIVEGYDNWDRVRYSDAKNALKRAHSSGNDLISALGRELGSKLISTITAHVELLSTVSPSEPSRFHLLDLLANATRRADEGRYEDAVARLYRATEAAAQLRLRDAYNIQSTSAVSFSQIPEALASKWRQQRMSEPLQLGLTRAYELLHAHGDPLGSRFMALDLHEKGSPLSARNMSIYAHGFEPVGEKIYHQLRRCILELCEIEESDLPHFPKLSSLSFS